MTDQVREVSTEHVDLGTGAVRQGGTVTQPANQTRRQEVDPKNPLSEPTIRVRVRPGVEFFHQGELVREGDEFDMAESIAVNAALYVDEIAPDGSLRAVQKKDVWQPKPLARAELAGRPAHERIGALETELKALDERRKEVEARLQWEKDLVEKQQREAAEAAQAAKQQAAQPQQEPARPASGEPARAANLGPQGTGDQATTGTTARPGEVRDPRLNREG
jgi:hypothetical protein